MSEIKAELKYTEEHEWATAAGGSVVKIGITDFAQCQLGDIVFIEFPEVGAEVEAGQPMGTIESVKTVSELYSPVSGKVAAINETLIDSPELVNGSPYTEGWLIEVEVEGAAEEALEALLTPEQYAAITAE